jgi:hypothetical protein
MTEHTIQTALYRWCVDKRHPVTIDNCGACTIGKADLLSVTKARFVHEFEIKCQASDFRREFETKDTKHRRLARGDNRLMSLPNYFWFATPEGLLDAGAIPDYAGLITVARGCCTVQIEAPRIHSDNLTDRDRRYIERGLTHRYWGVRDDQ